MSFCWIALGLMGQAEFVHLIARTMVDLSHMLALIGERDSLIQLRHQPGGIQKRRAEL